MLRGAASHVPVRSARLCVAVGLAVLGFGALAQARGPKPPKRGTPASAIWGAIEEHDGAVKDMRLFVKQALDAQKYCVTQQKDPHAGDWKGVKERGQAIALIANVDLKLHEQRLPKWKSVLKGLRVRGASRRKLKALAIAELKTAHTEHGEEIYDFHSVGVQLQTKNCSGALKYLKKAAKAGDYVGRGGGTGKPVGAWGNEFLGLKDAKRLLGLKIHLSRRVNPYLGGGVG